MPQLRLLREPTASLLVIGVAMPPSPEGRWYLTVDLRDFDGRGCGSGAWSIPRRVEHQDLGHVLKRTYDAWFAGDGADVMGAVERGLRDHLI